MMQLNIFTCEGASNFSVCLELVLLRKSGFLEPPYFSIDDLSLCYKSWEGCLTESKSSRQDSCAQLLH